MKLHHLRSATFIIESDGIFLLIDPMLSQKGRLPPFAFMRHPMRMNPTVGLPENASALLEKVTHCLITHSQAFGIKAFQHTDHLDDAGTLFLQRRNIPVATLAKDAAYLRAAGLTIALETNYWTPTTYLGGTLTAIPALHGHGWISRFMANGAGYFLQLPGEPSIYVAGDTVLTKDVERALAELRPDITVVACGGASLDIGSAILMSLEEVIRFVRQSPKLVIANHLEALNHCPTTRADLRRTLAEHNLAEKVRIPTDGETIDLG